MPRNEKPCSDAALRQPALTMNVVLQATDDLQHTFTALDGKPTNGGITETEAAFLNSDVPTPEFGKLHSTQLDSVQEHHLNYATHVYRILTTA